MKVTRVPGEAAALLAAALSVGGCSGLYAPGPPPPELVSVKVFGDPDEPLTGAEVNAGTGAKATTDGDGVAKLTLDGADGTRFDIAVTCPDTHGGGTRMLKVILRRGSRAPEYVASCKRTTRSVVVAVKAAGTSGLPIMNLGRELARTDEAGMALVHLDLKVGETFTLVLDTTDPRWAALRPQSPEVSFQVADSDELYVFEPKLHEERVVVKRAPAAKPFVPKRI